MDFFSAVVREVLRDVWVVPVVLSLACEKVLRHLPPPWLFLGRRDYGPPISLVCEPVFVGEIFAPRPRSLPPGNSPFVGRKSSCFPWPRFLGGPSLNGLIKSGFGGFNQS